VERCRVLAVHRGRRRAGPGLVEHAYDATARADPDDLDRALRAAWASGRVYWLELSARYGFPMPDALTAELEAALGR